MFEKKKKSVEILVPTPSLSKPSKAASLKQDAQGAKPTIRKAKRIVPKGPSDWQWYRDADAFREDGDWDSAEEIYVAVGEQAHLGRMASSAINCLVFSILIPQKRFVEARAWLQDSMDLEATYEAWNSLENLGVCEYTAGNNELAERYLEQVVEADDGPVDAAQKLLDKIRAGKFAKPVPKLNLEYSEEWKNVDVSGPLDPKSTQREFYLRLIKYMHETNQQFDKDSFKQSAGACITGFANGVLTPDLIEQGFTRDAAAKACLDYMKYVQLGQDPNEDAYAAGLELWNEGKKSKALSKLRIAAREGNVDAMLLVAQGVQEKFGEDLALPWYRLASANGSQEAEEYIMDSENSSWGDDDDDTEDEEIDDDTEEPTLDNSESRFCTNCGTARQGLAKFCTNCGTAIA
jgi:tetratricopeptide (TPR) repeat protein